MRADELTTGVTVFDEEGLGRGSSPAAGRMAVGLTVASRCLYLAPILWLPLLNDLLLAAAPALRQSALGRGAAAVALTALSSAYVTPFCLAIFDQKARVPPAALEPAFRDLRLSTGERVRALYFNKGL
jgi:hypothetical protein